MFTKSAHTEARNEENTDRVIVHDQYRGAQEILSLILRRAPSRELFVRNVEQLAISQIKVLDGI